MIWSQDLSFVDTFPLEGGTFESFLDAVTIWINKPHVANKRLSGTRIVQIKTVESPNSVNEFINSFLSDPDNDTGDTNKLEADLKEHEENFVIILRHLLPKQIKICPGLLEAVVFDKSSQSVTFLPLCYINNKHPDDSSSVDVSSKPLKTSETIYCFTFSQKDGNSAIQLSCKSPEQEPNPHPNPYPKGPQVHGSVSWLKETLGIKLQRWTEQSNLSTGIRSLRLVGVDRYSRLYSSLKDKYGAQLVKNWTETTDPHKFVYEDIGIATYLLLLWEEERQKTGRERKQSFVDLGCGNGLLVYILAKEGHQGLGIDLRKRKIWDTFDCDMKLEERPITPSADNLFPDYDWIIGNHSDELTPWIPVIAARSSYSCSYFVLPCCLHDFRCRFNMKVKGESNYRSYLTYISQVGQVCGFQVEEDTLRIPSTKRVCLVGRHRTYPQDQEPTIDQQRQEFIDKRCALNTTTKSNEPSQTLTTDNNNSNTGNPSLKRPHDDCEGNEASESGGNDDTAVSGSSAVWTENFQARSKTERVRNCQKVDQGTKDRVVRAVFDAVLAAEDSTEVTGQNGTTWRKGGSVALGTVAGMLDTATRESLKSECGGVQTLLRNHSNIFQVSGGRVQLRDFSVDDPWSPFSKAKKSRKMDPSSLKVALCWFHQHHPDGCPRTAEHCSFAHGDAELRPREGKPKR